MTIEQLLQLKEMGFNKEEIMRLLGDPAPADPAPADPAQADPAPDDRLTQLETKLDYAINRLNYMAVQGSQQPAGKEETIDDILASVVRGFEKEK